MDRPVPPAISAVSLYATLGSAASPLLIDVRRTAVYDADDRVIVGARRHAPDDVAQWGETLPPDRPIIVYCVHGHEVGKDAASALIATGRTASYLEGGIEAWRALGLPTRAKGASTPSLPSRWITRERPKIDRIACPWLIRRFIDPQAEFLYVPASDVLAEAERHGAIPYDIPGVTFSHIGERCSFDAFIDRFDIKDPSLDRLADIVRGADTSQLDLTPQSSGLFALSLGLSALFTDDHVMLDHGLVMYDALYCWCRSLQTEQHAWPPKMTSDAPARPENAA